MKRKWKGLLLFGTILMTIFALTVCGKEKINLNDYIQVTFYGYDTVGTLGAGLNQSNIYDMEEYTEATAYFLMMNVIEDNQGLFGLSSADMEAGWETSTEISRTFMKNVSGSFDKTSGLSNGDIITFQWSVNEEKLKELEKELNVKFIYSDMEITVGGLEEAEEWDPFEGVEIFYEGLAPYAYISYIAHPDDVPGLHYTNYVISDATSDTMMVEVGEKGFSNGDIITLYLYAPDNQDVTEYCMTYGKIPTALSKDFVVEGLEGYITNVADISSDLMDKMTSQGEDVFRAYVASKWDKPENLLDVSTIGNYFLVAKPDLFTDTNNEIYIVYKITALNPEPEEMVEFYYFVSWTNLMYLSDGTCSVDLGSYSTAQSDSNAKFKVGNYTYIGFENLETLFNRCVITKIDSYEYSSSIE